MKLGHWTFCPSRTCQEVIEVNIQVMVTHSNSNGGFICGVFKGREATPPQKWSCIPGVGLNEWCWILWTVEMIAPSTISYTPIHVCAGLSRQWKSHFFHIPSRYILILLKLTVFRLFHLGQSTFFFAEIWSNVLPLCKHYNEYFYAWHALFVHSLSICHFQ